MLALVILITFHGLISSSAVPPDSSLGRDSVPQNVRQSGVSTFMDSGPALSLFGTPAVTTAPTSDLSVGVHPRLFMNAGQWSALLNRYAANLSVSGSWSDAHRVFTLSKGPTTSFITTIASLDTSSYTGDVEDLTTWNSAELAVLDSLSAHIMDGDSFTSSTFFMCAFWAAVNDVLPNSEMILPTSTTQTCISAIENWSKVLLAHHAQNCGGHCGNGEAGSRASVWDYNRRWEISNDWYTATGGLALSYDVLHPLLTNSQRRTVRSAIALQVMKRESWGTTTSSTRFSPNCGIHPHRCFSNWATYHSSLYIANLAIEGESDFDSYTSAVLSQEGVSGFDAGLDNAFNAVYSAYLTHAVYPDGSTFEDAYTYFIALREGSLGLVAAERRGLGLLNTDRFRGLIHNLAQMVEPWQCGEIVGHAAGGGHAYTAYAAFFRYVYPDGELPNMLWRHRMGTTFRGNTCRTEFYQNMMQSTILGGEHATIAESPQGLTQNSQDNMAMSYYAPRRGLLIARNGFQEDDLYMHFDARPDAFFAGHDNADRGIFTFSAYRQTWVPDFPDWRNNVDSRKHSLVHVDGLAQDEKAPCVTMLKTENTGNVVIAAADLTYAYNVQWARNWPDVNRPVRDVITYLADGTETKVPTLYVLKEEGDPRTFGWPVGDDGADLGMTRPESNMWGDDDMGFMGMYTWKRSYRVVNMTWSVRSIALVREQGSMGYLLAADSMKLADGANHVYESYIMLHDDVDINLAASVCTGSECVLRLEGSATAVTDMHTSCLGSIVSFRRETFTTDKEHKRVILKCEGGSEEMIMLGFHAHKNLDSTFSMERVSSEEMKVLYNGGERRFRISTADHTLVEVSSTSPSPSPSATTSSTVSSAPSSSISPTMTVSPSSSPSPTDSATVSPSMTPTSSSSAQPSVISSESPTLTPTPSMTSSPTQTASPGIFNAPMSPLNIGARQWYSVRGSQFSSDRDEFLHNATEYDYQVVLRISGARAVRTQRRRNGRTQIQYDLLSTCHRLTRAVTHLVVYECGAERNTAMANYRNRNCMLVLESGSSDICKRIKTNVYAQLERRRFYFVALSVARADGAGDGSSGRGWRRVRMRYSTAWLVESTSS